MIETKTRDGEKLVVVFCDEDFDCCGEIAVVMRGGQADVWDGGWADVRSGGEVSQ